MAPRGWEGFRPDLAAAPAKRRRGGVVERAGAMVEAQTERELQAEVEGALRRLQAAGAIVDWYHRPDKAPRGAERPGLPDLIIAVRAQIERDWVRIPGEPVPPGKLVIAEGLILCVELKTATGKVRPEQARWLACAGARGCVARSLGEVLAFLRRWGVVGAGKAAEEGTGVRLSAADCVQMARDHAIYALAEHDDLDDAGAEYGP